jgi:hypothetical protein
VRTHTPAANITTIGGIGMMTKTEQEAFWRFELKPLALLIRVFIARGDYAK